MQRKGIFESTSITKAIPRDLGVDDRKEKRHKVRGLLTNELSPFYKKDMKDVFLYSLAIAIDRKLDPEPLDPRSASIPFSAFSDEQTTLIISLAISYENDLDFLEDEERIRQSIYRLESLSNSGLDLLYNIVFGTDPGNPDRKMEQRLFEITE